MFNFQRLATQWRPLLSCKILVLEGHHVYELFKSQLLEASLIFIFEKDKKKETIMVTKKLMWFSSVS
jgi:hypothetical protein